MTCTAAGIEVESVSRTRKVYRNLIRGREPKGGQCTFGLERIARWHEDIAWAWRLTLQCQPPRNNYVLTMLSESPPEIGIFTPCLVWNQVICLCAEQVVIHLSHIHL